MGKYVVIVLFLLGLWYILIPSGQAIPEASYYTNNRRGLVTGFYSQELQKLNCASFKLINPFCYIKPMKINHSTNLVSTYFAPKQKSTYLEEYFYPLKNSIIVNGYEPYDENGKPFTKLSEPLMLNGKQYNSIVTVRYYSSSIFSLVLIYLLIWLSIYWEIKLFTKIRDY
jgi:hypothetical protein